MFSQFKLYVIGGAFLAAILGSAWVTHKVDLASYEKLELSYQQAASQAKDKALEEQKRLDEIKTQVALEATKKQQKITENTQKRLEDVQKYVNHTCISYNTIRLLDATVLRRDPISLSIPSGKSAGSCSGLGADIVISKVIKNYGICQQNAEQLNSLIDFYNKTKRAPQN